MKDSTKPTPPTINDPFSQIGGLSVVGSMLIITIAIDINKSPKLK
jgi:hypothetical protein